MRTLDEAIANEREVLEKKKYQYECYMECSDSYKQNHKEIIAQSRRDFEEHERLAEWLEELKALRHEANEWRKAGYSHGYNKAIDDFVKACKENIMYKTFGLRECDIEQIAEQLKAGGENE